MENTLPESVMTCWDAPDCIKIHSTHNCHQMLFVGNDIKGEVSQKSYHATQPAEEALSEFIFFSNVIWEKDVIKIF